MSEILQIFSGNPLTTFVGKKVESATRPELECDDWALNLEICDIINENDDDAKDAIRAIRKRLQQIEQDRNFTVTNRTLTVLETCVSNCSRRFHVLVMTKDFIQDLVKLIGPKNNPPIDLQERVLRLIDRWADAFKGQPELGGVVAVYNDLKSKGVTFPERDPSYNVPIQTPSRSVPSPQAPSQPQQTMPFMVRPGPVPISQGIAGQSAQPPGPVVLEGESYTKITQDLSVVQTSVEMFDEILGQLEANKGEESDWRLAADMDVTCRQMKDRIVDLIERVANEDLTIEFLRLNDELNTMFTRYERQLKNRAKTGRSSDRAVTTKDAQGNLNGPATSSGEAENELSLIDFNTSDPSYEANETKELRQQQPSPIRDPFDSSAVEAAFAQSSRSKASVSGATTATDPLARDLDNLFLGSSNATESTSKKRSAALPAEISSVREQDFAEIENWLKTDSGGDAPSIEPISIPNSEFDNFIANRAMAGSTTTTTAPASASSSSTAHTTNRTDRKPEPSV